MASQNMQMGLTFPCVVSNSHQIKSVTKPTVIDLEMKRTSVIKKWDYLKTTNRKQTPTAQFLKVKGIPTPHAYSCL